MPQIQLALDVNRLILAIFNHFIFNPLNLGTFIFNLGKDKAEIPQVFLQLFSKHLAAFFEEDIDFAMLHPAQ